MAEDKQLMLLKTAKVLKPRERKFWQAFIENGGNRKIAYLTISPGIKDESAEVGGSRMMKQILTKLDDPGYFDEINMGIPRVMEKLNQLLEAESIQFIKTGQYGQNIVEKVTLDNTTQMKAVTLLAEINQMKKTTGGNEINVGVTVLKPDPIEKREVRDVN